MDAYSFLEQLFFPNIKLYFVALFISQLFLLPLYLRRVRSVIDPLLLSLFFVGLANAIPVFLLLTKNVSTELFSFFACSQILFCTIFYISSAKSFPIKKKGRKVAYRRFDDLFFKVCLALYVLTTLYSYAINGIPLFNENRFAQNIDNSSGILGLLSRLSSSVSLMVLIYTIYLFKNKRYKKSLLPIGVILIFSFFSGEKGFILNIVSAIFFYFLYYENYVPKIKKIYIVVGTLTPLLTIIIGGLSDLGSAFYYFIYRLLAGGDIYWNAYPNDIINSLDYNRSGLLNMSYMLWGPFRHLFGLEVNEAQMMTTVGADLFEITTGFYPSGGAPNSPFTVTFWAYYGWYSLIGVAILALGSSSLCYHVQNSMPNTLPNTCFKAFLFRCGTSAFIDIYLFFNNLFGLFLFYCIYKSLKFLFVNLSK